MTAPVVLADRGEPDRPYSHLLPVVEAEASWGNRPLDEFREGKDGVWYVIMQRPLHLDRLRDSFVFPPNVRLGRTDTGGTYVTDVDAWVRIDAVGPNAERGPVGGRRGVLSRVFGR